MRRDDSSSLLQLLDYIHTNRGIDFSAYKEASLKRRLTKRMQALEVRTYGEYLDHLEASPEEFTPLLDTLFINVTRFFRDREAWDVLRERVIPRILEGNGGAAPVRVWCAGVASGEEPYTIAILFAEALSAETFQERVKIYATDVDDAALARARLGVYAAKQLEEVDDELRTRYFDQSGDRSVFRSDLRRCMIFGRHNLLEDAPISRVDLLICRNTLMYFNREAQGRVLARFHFALRDEGFLFLGKAEMLLTRRNLFAPIDARSRIFTKSAQPTLRDRLSARAQFGPDARDIGRAFHDPEQSRSELETAYEELQSTNEELATTNEELQSTIEELETTNDELRERSDVVFRLNAYMRSILNSLQVGVVVLNTYLEVDVWNAKVSDLWGLREFEVEGQPFLNLDIGLPVDELRELMFRALRGEQDAAAVVLAAHDRRGKRLPCRVTCAPLHGPGAVTSGIILMMEDWRGRENVAEEPAGSTAH